MSSPLETINQNLSQLPKSDAQSLSEGFGAGSGRAVLPVEVLYPYKVARKVIEGMVENGTHVTDASGLSAIGNAAQKLREMASSPDAHKGYDMKKVEQVLSNMDNILEVAGCMPPARSRTQSL